MLPNCPPGRLTSLPSYEPYVRVRLLERGIHSVYFPGVIMLNSGGSIEMLHTFDTQDDIHLLGQLGSPEHEA